MNLYVKCVSCGTTELAEPNDKFGGHHEPWSWYAVTHGKDQETELFCSASCVVRGVSIKREESE